MLCQERNILLEEAELSHRFLVVFAGEERLSQVSSSFRFCHSTIVVDKSILFLSYNIAPFLERKQLSMHVIEPTYNYQTRLCTAFTSYSKKYVLISRCYLVPTDQTARERNCVFYGVWR